MKKRIEEFKNGAAQPERKTMVFEIWVAARCRLVKWLERKTANYSKTKAIVTLIVFCVGVILILCLIAGKGIYRNDETVFRIEELSRKVMRPPEERAIIPDGSEIAKRLSRCRKFLDSLSKNPALRHQYDSLMSVRPGLMDSLKMAEDYYKQ